MADWCCFTVLVCTLFLIFPANLQEAYNTDETESSTNEQSKHLPGDFSHCDADTGECSGKDNTKLSWERLPFMISPRDFHAEFVAKHKPVLFVGAAAFWPAVQLWTNGYISIAYSSMGSKEVHVTNDFSQINCHRNNKCETMPYEDFLKRQANTDNLVLMDEVRGRMLNDVVAPLCLRCEEVIRNVKISYWLGIHVKTMVHSSFSFNTQERLMTVIDGSIGVILVSSLQSKLILDQDILSLQGIPHINVNLQKGDMLYVPHAWWYMVTMTTGRSLVINFDWQVAGPTHSSIPRPNESIQKLGDQRQPQFIARLLELHEQQRDYSKLEPIKCGLQDKRMSEYTFETGKMSSEDYQQIHNGPDHREEELHCSFDESNDLNPCKSPVCKEDTDSPGCIRYTLEYCAIWEDRGCVIELPQALNKMNHEQRNEIFTMESTFVSDASKEEL